LKALRSAFRRCHGNRYFTRFRLVTQTWSPVIVPLLAVVLVALAVLVALEPIALLKAPALVALRVLLLLLLRGLTALALLLRLVHRVQDTEVMFRVLEERLGCHPVATACRVATKLQVFLKQLLGGAADADFRPVAVENMVAIQRNAAARVMANHRPTAAAAARPTTAATAA